MKPGTSFLLLTVLLTGCSGARQISRSSAGAYEVSMTGFNRGLAAAWYDERDGNPEIYVRLLDGKGRPLGPEMRLTDDPDYSYEPVVETIGGRLGVGWYEMSLDGGYRSRIALVDADGTMVWERAISNPGRYGRNVVLAEDGDDLVAAWIERDPDGTTDVWVGWWNASGEPVVPARLIARAGPTTWNLNLTLHDSEPWIVFDGRFDTDADELYLARVSRTAESVVRLTGDDGFDSKYPDLAISGDRAALTWFDGKDGNEEVYLHVGAVEDLQAGVGPDSVRVTETSGESIGAYVAWNRDRIGLAWNDDSHGQAEIYFQTFGSDAGTRTRARRLTDTPAESLIPAIRPWNDGFVLAWNEFEPASDQAHSGGRSQVVVQIVP